MQRRLKYGKGAKPDRGCVERLIGLDRETPAHIFSLRTSLSVTVLLGFTEDGTQDEVKPNKPTGGVRSVIRHWSSLSRKWAVCFDRTLS